MDGRSLARQGIADGSAIDLCMRKMGDMMHASSGRAGYKPIAHPAHPFAVAAKVAFDLRGEAAGVEGGASSGAGSGSAAIAKAGARAASSEPGSKAQGATFEQLYGLLEAADEADAAISGGV